MANFILRKVDDTLWDKFRARCQSEGHPMRWVILALIAYYIRKGLPK
jgi:hypothetical protein